MCRTQKQLTKPTWVSKMKKATARQKNAAVRRRLKDMLTTKRATSPAIVALLLILTTLVAGFFFYNFVMGSMGSMTSNFQEQMELLFLKSVSINSTHITSYVGNKGMWAMSIMDAYINDQIGKLLQSVEIEKDSVKPVYILGSFTKGLTYAVKLVTNVGGSLKFNVEYK